MAPANMKLFVVLLYVLHPTSYPEPLALLHANNTTTLSQVKIIRFLWYKRNRSGLDVG